MENAPTEEIRLDWSKESGLNWLWEGNGKVIWPSLVNKFCVIDFERILTVLRNTYKLFL